MSDMIIANNSAMAEMSTEALMATLIQRTVEQVKDVQMKQMVHDEKIYLLEQKDEVKGEKIDMLIEKMNYAKNDAYCEVRDLGSRFFPPMKNKMSLVLEWLGIVYYNSTAKKYFPYAKYEGKIVRSRPIELRNGYRTTEYTYHAESIIDMVDAKLIKTGLYNEFSSHITKEERDAWISRKLESQR